MKKKCEGERLIVACGCRQFCKTMLNSCVLIFASLLINFYVSSAICNLKNH